MPDDYKFDIEKFRLPPQEILHSFYARTPPYVLAALRVIHAEAVTQHTSQDVEKSTDAAWRIVRRHMEKIEAENAPRPSEPRCTCHDLPAGSPHNQDCPWAEKS